MIVLTFLFHLTYRWARKATSREITTIISPMV